MTTVWKNLEIGKETAEAMAYFEFQQYVKAHKDLGVLLTVCSKNEEENALAGLSHPEGVLRPDDFVAIRSLTFFLRRLFLWTITLRRGK